MKLRLLSLPLIAGFVLALAVSCGGDKKDADTASADSTSGGGSTSAQVLDLTQSAAKLQDLRSFRFDLALKMDLGGLAAGDDKDEDGFGAAFAQAILSLLGDVKAEGAVVAPDDAQIALTLGGRKVEFVQVGDKRWVKDNNGSWKQVDEDDIAGALGGLGDIDPFGSSPSDLLDQFLPNEVLKGAKTSRETVNGVSTTHYAFDKKTLQSLADDLNEKTEEFNLDFKDVDSANLDVWLTDDNIPVKVTMVLAGKDESGHKISLNLSLNVRDINDASIKIKPPI